MPQKNKKISSLRFIYSTAIMPKTPAKCKKKPGKLTDEAESCKVCLARSAKLAKSMEVPLVVTPEAALYARASKIHACGLALMSAHVSKIFTLQLFCSAYIHRNSIVQKNVWRRNWYSLDVYIRTQYKPKILHT